MLKMRIDSDKIDLMKESALFADFGEGGYFIFGEDML